MIPSLPAKTYKTPQTYKPDDFELLIFDYYSVKFRTEFKQKYGDKIQDDNVYNDTSEQKFKEHMLEKYGIDIQGIDSNYHFSYKFKRCGIHH